MHRQVLIKIRKNFLFLFSELFDNDIIVSFSCRGDGNMSLCYGDIIDSLENRKKFLGRFHIDYRNLVCAKQSHTGNVAYIEEKETGKGALSYNTALDGTDALITDKKNIPLAVFTADCLSIFLYDPKNSVIGLVHAGWRSTKDRIVANTVRLMQDKFTTQAKDLYVSFGPAIRNCCYEVGREFQNFFNYGLEQRNGRYYLDLIGINKKQFIDLGINKMNIFDCNICTSCQNETFFSYRKEGISCGRMISVIILKN